MKKVFAFVFCIYILNVSFGQAKKERGEKITQIAPEETSLSVYPTNWWVGMKNPKLQLMLHGASVGSSTVTISYPGITVSKINKVENKNYLFVDLIISGSAKAGT